MAVFLTQALSPCYVQSAVTISPSQIDYNCAQIGAASAEAGKSLVKAAGSSEPYYLAPAQKIIDAGKIDAALSSLGAAEVLITLNTDTQAGKESAKNIDFAQAQLLEALSSLNTEIKYICANVPVISARIDSQAFEYLKNSGYAAAIEPVMELEPHTSQGIALINGDIYRSVYDGSGVSVAVIDSGIDYTHPALGGAGLPNSKVLGGYDFANGDEDPKPWAFAYHGTCCAGIIAGDIAVYEDYKGGVAPGAKLYALKVMPDGSSSITTANLVSAVDWCISHQYDDPNNPILVINMSLGGGRYLSSCDSSSEAMSSSVTAAEAAGITVVASSGNDGYCDAISFPACLSNVIAVGAVFDNDLGAKAFCLNENSCIGAASESCTAPSKYYATATAADAVPPYSNSCALVDILAPSHNAFTTDIKGVYGVSVGDYYGAFGGTSAACAYASGAVASLQSAAFDITGRYLTPFEVSQTLKTWADDVLDTKNSQITPRINLADAIDELEIFNSPQISVYNDTLFPGTVTSVLSPSWINVFPQPPFDLKGYQTKVLYAAGDCAQCDYQNLSGEIVITVDSFPSDVIKQIAVSMDCPACGLSANLNGGCEVNLEDLVIFADCWLNTLPDCLAADINGSGIVCFEDFSIMAEQWLSEG